MTTVQAPENDDKIGIVHLISGTTAQNELFYAYLCVKPSRYEDFFLVARGGEAMDLEEYGLLMKRGFGATPPDSVQKEMEDIYGVDHKLIEKIEIYGRATG
jgi:hypothetical protein